MASENPFEGFSSGALSILVTTSGGSHVEGAVVTMVMPVRDSISLEWSGVTDSLGRIRFTNSYHYRFSPWTPVEITVAPPDPAPSSLGFAPRVIPDSFPHAVFPERAPGHTVQVTVEPSLVLSPASTGDLGPD